MQRGRVFRTMGGVTFDAGSRDRPLDRLLDRAFDAYRRRGDVDALGRVFDATANRLLLLAERIVQDRHLAEDALQRTFLRAIEKRDTWDARRPLWPWLTGILALEARAARRREHRPPPDRESTATKIATPLELAASRDELDRVAAAIDSLGSAYRSVLTLHLIHGLQPAQIATALELSGGTVRSRLTRGLAKLREKLPASVAACVVEFGGGDAIPSSVRTTVLDAAARSASVAAPAASALTTMTGFGLVAGALLMKKTTAAVSICVLVILGSIAFGAGPFDRRAPDREGSPAETDFGSVEIVSNGDAESAREPAVRATDDPPALRDETCAVFGVVAAPDGTPVPGARVRVIAHHGSPYDAVVEEWPEATTAVDGRYEVRVDSIFDQPPVVRGTAELFVVVTADGYGTVRDNGGARDAPWLSGRDRRHQRNVRLHPRRGAIVGRVVDSLGQPVPGARVAGEGPGNVYPTRTAADGSFALRATAAGTYRVRASHPQIGKTAAPIELRVRPPADQRVDDLVLVRDVIVTGRLRMADGTPAGGIRYCMTARRPGGAATRAEAVTDDDGRFTVATMPPAADTVDGTYELSIDYLHREDAPTRQVFVVDPRRGPQDFVLAGQHTTIAVTDSAGRPVGGSINIQVWSPARAPDLESLRRMHDGVDDPRTGATRCEHRCGVLATGSAMAVAAHGDGCLLASAIHVAENGVSRSRIELTLRSTSEGGGRLRFDVRDERGERVADYAVRVLRPLAGIVVASFASSEFATPDVSPPLPAGPLRIVLSAGPVVGTRRSDRSVIERVRVVEGETRSVGFRTERRGFVCLELTRGADTVFGGAELSGVSNGAEIRWRFVRRHVGGGWIHSSTIHFDDSNSLGPLIGYARVGPGPVSITIDVTGGRRHELRADVRPHEITSVPFEFGGGMR